MDFRDLQYVLAIARYQNITKAAESLYVTQPTLSKFLSSLEAELGQKLFRKAGHKYVLTLAGEKYVEKAKQIMNLKNDLDAELEDILKNDRGVLNVCYPPMRITYMLPKVLPEFAKMHPNVKVNVYEGSSDTNDKRIIEGQAELAFFSMPENANPNIEYEILGHEEMLICTCKDHPLKKYAEPNPNSRYPRLNPELLKNEKILEMLPDARTRQISEAYFKRHGLEYENCMFTSNLMAIMELVAAGYGVSFIFETHLRHRQVQTPIDCYSFGHPRTTSNFVVAYRKGSYLPNYARDFIEISKKIIYEAEQKKIC